mmetsp:Transcript_78892/g.226034  ORF Transcript_78892/g.226034 Transcript_78892/m.226034 type:complete len:205 (+) Transcript_78892:276-890(+)
MPAASSISISSEDSKQAPWCGHLASVTWTRFCSGPGAPTLNQKMTSWPVGSFSLRPGGLTLAISRSTRLCCSLLPPPAASKCCWYSCIQACPSTKSEALRIGVRNHNTSSSSTRSGASSGALRRGRRLDARTDGVGAAELAATFSGVDSGAGDAADEGGGARSGVALIRWKRNSKSFGPSKATEASLLPRLEREPSKPTAGPSA